MVPSLFQCLWSNELGIQKTIFKTPLLPWRRKQQQDVFRNAKQAEKSETVTHHKRYSHRFQVSANIMNMYEYVSLSLSCKLSSRTINLVSDPLCTSCEAKGIHGTGRSYQHFAQHSFRVLSCVFRFHTQTELSELHSNGSADASLATVMFA